MLGTLAVVEAHDLDASERRDRHGLELRTRGPALAKAAAVQIDEHAISILGRDAVARGVDVGVHAADRGLFTVDGKQLALPRDVPREKRRHAVLLDEHLGPLQIAEVLGEIRFAFEAQEARHGHACAGMCTVPSGSIDDLRRCGRLREGCSAEQHEEAESDRTPGTSSAVASGVSAPRAAITVPSRKYLAVQSIANAARSLSSRQRLGGAVQCTSRIRRRYRGCCSSRRAALAASVARARNRPPAASSASACRGRSLEGNLSGDDARATSSSICRRATRATRGGAIPSSSSCTATRRRGRLRACISTSRKLRITRLLPVLAR